MCAHTHPLMSMHVHLCELLVCVHSRISRLTWMHICRHTHTHTLLSRPLGLRKPFNFLGFTSQISTKRSQLTASDTSGVSTLSRHNQNKLGTVVLRDRSSQTVLSTDLEEGSVLAQCDFSLSPSGWNKGQTGASWASSQMTLEAERRGRWGAEGGTGRKCLQIRGG